MTEMLIVVLLLLVLLLQILAVLLGLRVAAMPRTPRMAVPSLDAPEEESEPDGEPTAEAVMRHHHRYGPKDDDGIRHCRCGDRYLDGMVV